MLGLKIGIDFGSANLTVYVQGKGIVMSEPSVLICDSQTGKVLAIGSAAYKMVSKLPESMRAVYPIKDGIINDYDSACYLLRTYISRICHGKLLKPSVLICVPSTITQLQQKTIINAVTASGAGRVCFAEETLAAAAGAGLDFISPKAKLICDIGGGTCNVAVVTLGGIAVSKTIKTGGNTLTQNVREYIARQYNTEIGFEAAENIKICAGSAVMRRDEVSIITSGKKFGSGDYIYAEITSTEIYDAMQTSLNEMLSCVLDVLEITPPELCADIKETGLLITGGTAKLHGLNEYFSRHTGLEVHTVEDPEQCAAKGLGRLLSDIAYLERNGYVFKSGDERTSDEEN